MRARESGFTLIELLIVVVIIGILAAIAIPKFGATKEKAYIATMKSDLHNLSTAEESFFYDSNTYYGGVIPGAAIAYKPSAGVSVTVNSADGKGWAATATSTYTSRTCAVFYGSATPPSPATVEGVVACQ
jgi:prepilin-type N-terminal cleavage/methylation domain-containing protein